MLRTVVTGSAVSVQGTFVQQLPGNRIAVRVGDKVFAGTPVDRGVTAAWATAARRSRKAAARTGDGLFLLSLWQRGRVR